MHIFKIRRYQVLTILLIVLLVFSGVFVSRVLNSHADSGNTVPMQSGETAVTGEITNYSGNDGGNGGVFPPSTSIDWPASAGYATVHSSPGGTGTYDDPITVAINSKNGPSGDIPNDDTDYHIGEKFYVPQLHLYFVAEDSCNIDIDYAACSQNGTMQDNSSELHMDLFNGSITDSSNFQNEQNCEDSYGGNTPVIANAGPGYPMPDQYPQGTTLFVAPNTCVGNSLWNEYNGWTIDTSTTTTLSSTPTVPSTGSSFLETSSLTPTPTPTTTSNTPATQTAPVEVDDSQTGTGLDKFHFVGNNWHSCQSCDNASVGFYDGSDTWDNTAGDSLTIAFTGTQIKFYGVVGPDHGIAQVSIDGATSTQIDFYQPNEAGNTALYISPVLTSGQHTFKLVVTGLQNAHAIANYVNPDHVEITSVARTAVTARQVVTTTSNLAVVTNKNSLDPTASDSNWSMVWNDDFSTSSLDTSKWTVQTYAAGAFNNEQECYVDNGTQVQVDGTGASSHLMLEADKSSGDCQYVSGRIDTSGKYAVQPPTSGKPVRVEASMQLPVGGAGVWPAFWMLGQDIDSVGWPACGEIDIMENIPAMGMSTIQSTIHGNGDADQQETLSSGKYSDGYHLIAMDWYTDHIIFSVDGKATQSIDTTQLGGDSIFNQPFFILLNVAIGGDWPGNADSSTPFPQQMNVAFVRVYQHV